MNKGDELLLVDAEEDFSAHEVEKLERDVMGGLSLIVFADWHDQAAFTSLRFRDENTRRWWSPAVGGANVPAQMPGPASRLYAQNVVSLIDLLTHESALHLAAAGTRAHLGVAEGAVEVWLR